MSRIVRFTWTAERGNRFVKFALFMRLFMSDDRFHCGSTQSSRRVHRSVTCNKMSTFITWRTDDARYFPDTVAGTTELYVAGTRTDTQTISQLVLSLTGVFASFDFESSGALKPGFHYPSWRPESTARVDGWPVSITCQHG